MKKHAVLLYSISVGIIFFGIMFTLIRTFYFKESPSLQDYIFPFLLGTFFGTGIGLWRIQANDKNEKLELIAFELGIANTELKRNNKKLLETQTKLRSLLDNIPDLVWLKDTNGVYMSCNPQFEKYFGAKESEIAGRTDYDFVSGELADFSRQKDKDAITADKPQKSKEWITLAADGSRILLETIKKPIKDENGRILGVLGIGRDITALYDAETTSHDTEEKFRTIFKNMALGCCLDEIVYDNNGNGVDYRILDVNPVYEKLIGISKTRAIGKLASVLCGSGMAPNMDVYNAVDKTGEPATFEIFFPPTERHLLITASRLSKGRFCTLFSDITERNKLIEQLQQAQKMESVGRLAGGVAHDFNNMLGVILGHAELSLNAVRPDELPYEHLKGIINASKRSSGIIKQLLAFARKQTISPMIININETVVSMLKMLKRLIGENIDLIWEPSKELRRVKMDPSQVDQILANLCVNAKDAISDTGKITIRTENITLDKAFCVDNLGSVPGDYVLLEVSDDGCGMSNDTIDKVFEPFFTTKEAGKGTGLGLSTVYGIVKQNSGFIYARSKTGQGTTFSIYLPENKEESKDLAPRESEEVLHGHEETVLLVEDEEINLEMFKAILVQLDYNVLTADRPTDALALANKHKGDIDLLIADVILPEMNGSELSTRLRNIFPNMKTLFMSGYTNNEIAQKGMLEEGVNFIHKPFPTQDFSIKIRAVLDD